MDVVIKVGCCGTSGLSLQRYSKEFDLLEVQRTFYNLLKTDLANKWRSDVGMDFEFTVKVFQGITHPVESPTWRRHKEKLQGIDPNEVGLLRTTPFVKTCWEQNVDFAHALKAKIAVIQLPPSFQYDTSGFERLKTFFEFVEPDITCAIEFRHVSWIPRINFILKNLKKWDVIIVSDPLKFNLPRQDTQYFRLHGMNGFVNYRYVYTDQEIDRLMIEAKKGNTYVLFNNISMLTDAKRFLSKLH